MALTVFSNMASPDARGDLSSTRGPLSSNPERLGIATTADDRMLVTIGDPRGSNLGSTAMPSTQSLTTFPSAQATPGGLDAAILARAVPAKSTLLKESSRGTATLGGTSSHVSSEGGAVGAYESWLGIPGAKLTRTPENISAAQSRIRDVDVAEEGAAMTRHNIFMRAGVSVLGQANQLPSLVLNLLRPLND